MEVSAGVLVFDAALNPYGWYGLGGWGVPTGLLARLRAGWLWVRRCTGTEGMADTGNWGYPYGCMVSTPDGYGPSNWLYGGSLYDYGYLSYVNPYYVSLPGVVVDPYDYSLPISTASPPPGESVVDESLGLFQSARDAFKAGN